MTIMVSFGNLTALNIGAERGTASGSVNSLARGSLEIRMLRSLALVLLLAAIFQAAESLGHSSVDKEVREVFPGLGEYYFNGIPSNWTDAYKQCKLSGGHLAVINSQEEVVALKQMMTKFSASLIHLGFHDQLIEGDYTTILGMDVDSECGAKSPFWAADNPKGATTYNCGGFSAQGMIDTDCALKSVFICELTEEQGGETPADDYDMIEGHGLYKYHNVNATWPEAWAACRGERAHLLIVNSYDEQYALQQAYKYKYTWVGVHRLYGGNKDFVTVFDQPLEATGYTTWYGSMEPFGTYITHPYVVLYDKGGLYMLGRTVSLPFVCERD